MPENESTTYPYPYSPNNKEKSNLLPGSLVDALRCKIAPFRFDLAAEAISKELGLKGGENILEIGSGLGLLGRSIVKKVGENKIQYFGVDLVLNSAEKSKKWIRPVQADAVFLPFENNSFDYIISTDVLEHVVDAPAALKEIYRVLKPGGKAFIVIADPSEGRFANVKDHIRRSQDNSDIPYWTERFSEAGFRVLEESSRKYRSRDWRRIFNLPFLVKLKNKPGFACAFNPVNRPGVYIVEKPQNKRVLINAAMML